MLPEGRVTFPEAKLTHALEVVQMVVGLFWEVPNGGLTNGGVRATCEEIIALWKATSLANAPKSTPCYKMTLSAALRTTTCNKTQISELDRGLYQKNTQGYKHTGFVTPPFVTPPFGTG